MKKLLAVLLVLLLVVTGCSGGSNASEKSYTYVYTTDIDTLDYLITNKATNGDHFANFVDGLFENDAAGRFVPALADGEPEVSEDQLTWTYKIKKDIKWVTSSGEEYATVKPSDWVAALEYAALNDSGTLEIVLYSIKGLAEFYEDPSLGFDTVGIKADDEAMTLSYTLNAPEPFWNTKTTYSILLPVNPDFLASKGDDFGTTEASSILYNGGYILSQNTAGSKISYTKNPAYWDAANVFVEEVNWIYYTGDDPESLYRQFTEGTLTQARVYPTYPSWAEIKEADGDNIILSNTGPYSYGWKVNVNRQVYAFSSKTTDKEKADTRAALLNKDFRNALIYAFDNGAYNAQSVGEDVKLAALRNMLTPPTFVTGGGKTYHEMVEAELVKMDGEFYKDIDLRDGQQAYYNPEKAVELFEAAKAALTGVDYPIRIDILANSESEIALNQAKSMKSSIEAALGAGNVQIDINQGPSKTLQQAYWIPESGQGMDYDLSPATGWGPDFMDPSTYLGIFDINTGAYMRNLGLDALKTSTAVQDDPAWKANVEAAIKAVGLDEFQKILDDANAIIDDNDARFAAQAEAEAWIIDSGLSNVYVASGATPSVSRVVPFTRPFAWSGLSSSKFKFMRVQKDPVSTKEFDAAREKWEQSLAN